MIELFHSDAYAALDGNVIGDVLLTDPPYDANVHSTMTLKGTLTNGVLGAVDPGFAALTDLSFVPRFVSSVRRWSLFFCALEALGDYREASPDTWIRSGIYAKGKAMPQITGDRPGNRCEGIAIFHPLGKKRWNGRGTAALWIGSPENRKKTGHPTAKPLLLCMRLVDLFSDEGETVIDPFAGSGTIGLACAALGRSYVGVEIDAAAIDNARRRHREFDAGRARALYADYCDKYVGPGNALVRDIGDAGQEVRDGPAW